MDMGSLYAFFPPEISGRIRTAAVAGEIREIRLRAGAPPVVLTDKTHILEGEAVSAAEVQLSAQRMCQNSVYARQAELKNGFITLPGGHRAGFCGRTVVEDGKVRALTEISSINLRVAHAVSGVANKVLPHILACGEIQNTLIVSPPGAGKTTLLRDIARQLGSRKYGFRVGIADERGEIAAMYRGMPQKDVGILTDVYDGCPKAQAMQMLLRGMAPDVVITDELGGAEEEKAVRALVHAGVRVICSLHGKNRADALAREHIGALLKNGVFQKVVTLGGVGKIVSIT